MGCNEMNTLKIETPNGIKSKDVVYVTECNSLVFGYGIPSGYYYLDTYDECDGSCYIALKLDHIPKKPHKTMSYFTYNVSLDVIITLEDMFGDVIAKAVEDLDDMALLKLSKDIPQCEFKVELFKKVTTIQKKLKNKK